MCQMGRTIYLRDIREIAVLGNASEGVYKGKDVGSSSTPAPPSILLPSKLSPAFIFFFLLST